MNQSYIQLGGTFTPFDSMAAKIQPVLPPGTYTIMITETGPVFRQVENFTLPDRLYGNTNELANRILDTFSTRPMSTGILLAGHKGSGKTLLAKKIAMQAIKEHNMVVIVINSPMAGEGFNALIQSVNQPAVVLFDEFEKIYDSEHQTQLLTILDGTYPTRKLFILTCNNKYRIDENMHNRPGRLFYALDFEGLSTEAVTEYCQDNLKNMENLRGVLNVAGFFKDFTFDMLCALVEEMNRYDETATEAMKMLNIKPLSDSYMQYNCELVRQGTTLKSSDGREFKCKGHPMSLGEGWHVYVSGQDDVDFDFDSPNTDEEKANVKRLSAPCYLKEGRRFIMDKSKLISADYVNQVYVFGTDDTNTVMKFSRVESTGDQFHINYDAI